MAESAGRRDGLAQLDDEALRLRHHALRQPLNALGLYCEALKMQPLTAAQQPLLAGMEEAAQLMERLVDEHFSDLRGLGEPAEGTATRPKLPGEQARVHAHALSATTPETGLDVDGSGHPISSPQTLRIAVVDDDEAARMGMVLLLEAWGASVQPFASLHELRAWTQNASSTPPDLLILDYHLPRPGDGLEALRMFRQAWPSWTLRALLITGDERAAVANALTDGSLECLIKPVTPGPLLAALRQQLGAQFGV